MLVLRHWNHSGTERTGRAQIWSFRKKGRALSCEIAFEKDFGALPSAPNKEKDSALNSGLDRQRKLRTSFLRRVGIFAHLMKRICRNFVPSST